MAWRVRRAPDLEGVPEEEGISEADAARRVGKDPDQQENRTDRPRQGISEAVDPDDS